MAIDNAFFEPARSDRRRSARAGGRGARSPELAKGALSLDGALPVLDLKQRLRLDALLEGSYHAAAGLVLALLGRLPGHGDVVEWSGWNLEVTAIDGLGIERIVARRALPPDASHGAG